MGEGLSSQKTLVISAVNFTEGGPLTVLRDCVESAAHALPAWRIVVMAHDAALLQTPGIEVRAFPHTKTSWLKRMVLEWVGFKRISEELDPDFWLSLHDMTPRVKARRQAVYCHNPSPFYALSLREIMLEPKLFLFRLFYARLYGLLISRNTHVIVQQQWLRDEFRHRFGAGLPVVVAHPALDPSPTQGRFPTGKPFVFLYPALPRVFKNLQALGEASRLLHARGVTSFEIRLTIDGAENRYARWLQNRFGGTPGLTFMGRQTPAQMAAHYGEAHALLFPSKLETWGLPITEAKQRGLPMLVADAPYARETVGTYDQVTFFAPDDAAILAKLMLSMIDGSWIPSGNVTVTPEEPFAANWTALWRLLTDEPSRQHGDARQTSFEIEL